MFECFKLSNINRAKAGGGSGIGTSETQVGEQTVREFRCGEKSPTNCERQMWECRTIACNPDILWDGEIESSEMELKLKQELGQNFITGNRWD